MSDAPSKLGRPTDYSPELSAKVLDAIATNDKGLDELHELYDWFPNPSTVYRWRIHSLDFSKKYMEAKNNQAQIYAESTLKIAKEKYTYFDEKGNERVDVGHVAWQKLNVHTRQWHASKLAPKIYGDQKQIEDLTVRNESLQKDIEKMRAELMEKYKKDF